MEPFKNKIASYLYQLGISADFLTYTGLACALISGTLAYEGRFFWAGGALLLAGFMDLMDGAVARQSKVVSPFGGILDSSLDRYGDGFILLGVLFYCVEYHYIGYAALAASALVGSFLVSYVRARAECTVPKCKVGFWERGERLVWIALGLLTNNLPLVLWVLGIGVHLTVLHRLASARRISAGHADGQAQLVSWAPAFLKLSVRGEAPYLVKCVLLFFLLLFCRLSFRW